MVCAACGAQNEAGRKFCGECGSRLVAVCPACGASNQQTVRFCGECGTALAAADHVARPASPSAPPVPALVPVPTIATAAAERRLVSVLFADLVGFTALSEDRDPEATRELLTRYFDVARDVIARYGGTVEKFIGDAVMAVWGAPVAHEDDAERAVRAALELVGAIRALGDRPESPLQLRAGVLTGEAAVTVGAEGQGMVAGDLVNTASRLQSVAPPNTVLVGEATYRAASGAIAFEPAGERLLKGRTAPVAAWRALRVVAMVGGAGRADRLEPPFVGRDAELGLVKQLLHATGRERRPRLISITGQAGVGKSRLVWEFHKYIDGISEGINWHHGRSPAYGEGITFWALGEMVRKRAGLRETDDAATTRSQISAALLRYVPNEGERRWIEPRLLQLLGVEEGPGGEREELFAAWRTFFERISEEDTTVLVFEDLQWADSGLIDFINHVLEWSRNHPILIVTLARPELLDRRPDWGSGRRNFMSLSLEPLADADMRELLARLVPGLPIAASAAILARAGGVPLYAVETVRMLLGQGRLEEHAGAYRPVGDIGRLDVPDSLHALIAARLDGLNAPDRALLQDAAVLGQTFSLPALSALTGQSAQAMESRLRELIRQDLVTLDVDPRSPERGQYGFVQELVREVAYGTLARRDRRARHLAAARYFEALGDEELVGVLATHYRDAYLASPDGPEGAALAAQARIALKAAAERAASLHSYEQTLTYLEQALEVTADPVEEADLHERAGNAAIPAGAFAKAETHYGTSATLYRALGDEPAAARATAGIGVVMVRTGRPQEAIALLEDSLRRLPDPDRSSGGVGMMSQLARAYMLHEQPQLSVEWADRALVAAERLDLIAEIADAMNTRALGLQIVGRFREASTNLRGVLSLAKEHGLVHAELRAYNNLSFMLAADDPRACITLAAEGIERARHFGDADWASSIASNAAASAFRAGAWETAIAAHEEWQPHTGPDVIEAATIDAVIRSLRGESTLSSLDELAAGSEALSDPQVPAILDLGRAWIALADGRLADAKRWAMRGASLATGYSVTGFPLAARAALWAGDGEGVRAAVDAFEAIGVHGRAIEAARRMMQAARAAVDGRTADAVTGYVEAGRRWRELAADFELAMCQMDFALALADVEPAAVAAADEARGILGRLGVTTLLERLDRRSPVEREAPAAPVRPASSETVDSNRRSG